MPDKKLTPEEIEANLAMVRHIRAWLKRGRVTQRKLADELNMSEPSISKWLRGLQSVNASQIQKIGAVIGVDPQHLLRDPNEDREEDSLDPIMEVADNLSDEDKKRWLEFGRNLASSGSRR